MNIWFKYEGEPVEISFKGKNVNALKEQIKTKLKNQLGKFDIDQITLQTPEKHESLCAEMTSILESNIYNEFGFACSISKKIIF